MNQTSHLRRPSYEYALGVACGLARVLETPESEAQERSAQFAKELSPAMGAACAALTQAPIFGGFTAYEILLAIGDGSTRRGLTAS